jgi:hypothetical protein
MQKLQSIVTLIAIAIAILAMTGVLNPYKKKYLTELKAQEEASQAKVDTLQSEIFMLEVENAILEERTDSVLVVLGTSETKRKQERDAHNRKMAELGKLSNAELARYFAERYNRK